MKTARKSVKSPKVKLPPKREIVGRISSMYVVVENEYGDRFIACNKKHRCYNHMWEWDRLDRREWYMEYGGAWDEYAELGTR